MTEPVVFLDDLLGSVHASRLQARTPATVATCTKLLRRLARDPAQGRALNLLRSLPALFKAECMLAVLKHLHVFSPSKLGVPPVTGYLTTLMEMFWQNGCCCLCTEALATDLVRGALDSVLDLCAQWPWKWSGSCPTVLKALVRALTVLCYDNKEAEAAAEANVCMVLQGLLEVPATPALASDVAEGCHALTPVFDIDIGHRHRFCEVVWASWRRSRRPQCHLFFQKHFGKKHFGDSRSPTAVGELLWLDAMILRQPALMADMLHDDFLGINPSYAVATAAAGDDFDTVWEVLAWLRTRRGRVPTVGLFPRVQCCMARWLGLRSAWVAAVVSS